MSKIPFSEDELKVVGEHISPTFSFGGPPLKYNTPVTVRENVNACLRRDGSAMWIPGFGDFLSVQSRVNCDHIARAEVMDMGPLYSDEEKGGKDLFGIEWIYVPVAGGSMVKPGNPLLEDVNDWPEVIKFPDIDAMDWDSCAKLNAPLNKTERAYHITFQNGMFERLISFMDFEGAALAIIDEDQKEAIHSLFARLCDMYEAIINKYMEGLTIDGVMFHDDWGSQRAPFFSPETCREMIVPYIKRLSDFCHAKGLWFEQHSCGKNELLVPAMIEAGVDMWFGQSVNDADMLREKYGDKIMLGVYPPETAPDASDEEIDQLAKEFAQKYAPDMGTRPVVMVDFMADPRFKAAVYKYSRIILAE
ncbi:MAG: uroporphyrinogen decarboxylase family protein [Lachnospiraceae bacterium]|nr:uroporphyrinogen decarboxylase family protein [Lachnospiraceae bacterium]